MSLQTLVYAASQPRTSRNNHFICDRSLQAEMIHSEAGQRRHSYNRSQIRFNPRIPFLDTTKAVCALDRADSKTGIHPYRAFALLPSVEIGTLILKLVSR
jgi:hypothetical protein